ncbi:hypothetical protein ACEQPO_08420 [Bacillus sp. SL00103]
MVDGTEKEVIEAFRVLRDFYKSDVQFDQFMEQLAIDGVNRRHTSIDSLRDTKNFHNQILVKQENLFKMKKARRRDFNTMIFYSVAFIGALMFSFTIPKIHQHLRDTMVE